MSLVANPKSKLRFIISHAKLATEKARDTKTSLRNTRVCFIEGDLVFDSVRLSNKHMPKFRHIWAEWCIDGIYVLSRRVFPSIPSSVGLKVALESSQKGFGIKAIKPFKKGEVIVPVEGVLGPLKYKPKAGEVLKMLNVVSGVALDASRVHIYQWKTRDAT